MVVTSGIHQEGRTLQRLLALIALLAPLTLVVAGARAVIGDFEGAIQWLKAAPILAVWTVVLGPLAIFRHRVILDRGTDTLVHDWGWPLWTWRRRSFPLAGFRVDDADGAQQSRSVVLTDGRERVTLRRFAYALQAWNLAGRAAAFLGQELRRPSRPPKIISYVITRFLLGLGAVFGLILGTGFFFLNLGWRGGSWLPASDSARIAVILLLWTGSVLVCTAVLTCWAPFVPIGCPRCGGRARLVMGWWPYYACRDCGSSWREGTGDGIGPG